MSWQKSVEARPEFDASDKKRMLLSNETLQGIHRTGI